MSLAAIPVFLLARRLRVGDRLALAAAPSRSSCRSSSTRRRCWRSRSPIRSRSPPLRPRSRRRAAAAAAPARCLGLLRPRRLQPAPAGDPAPLLPGRDRRGRPPRAPVAHEGSGSSGLPWGRRSLPRGGLVVGLVGSLGVYGSLTAYSVEPVGAAKAFGANALVLGYAAGWVMVPGALLGLALALARPRGRAEFAFGVLALSLLVSLLIQAALVGDVGRVQERYVIYAVPLVVCLFALYAARGWPHLRVHALLAALAAGAAVVPLAGYAAGGGYRPVVRPRRRCRSWSGSSVTSAWRRSCSPRQHGCLGARPPSQPRGDPARDGGGAGRDRGRRSGNDRGGRHPLREQPLSVRAIYLPADPSWVDAAGSGPVTLLVAPHSARADLLTTLFWNRSVRRLVLLDGAGQPDRSRRRRRPGRRRASRRHDRAGPGGRARLLPRPPQRRARRSRRRPRPCGGRAARRSSRS